MNGTGWVAATALAVAAVVILAPTHTARTRWRGLSRTPAAEPARAETSRDPSQPPDADASRYARVRTTTLRHPWRAGVLAGVGSGLLGAGLAGPVAAVCLATYGVCGATVGLRGLRRRLEAQSHTSVVSAVGSLAAELRAGLPVDTALATTAAALKVEAAVGADAATVARRVAAAVHLAETIGAPLADVLDRLESDIRMVDRARATAAAQSAGARASASLLAAMPVAGVGLGFVVGTDPLQVLLHTPLGAGCLTAAVVLQLAGLAWSVRLSRMEVAA